MAAPAAPHSRPTAPVETAMVRSLIFELTERCNNDCRHCYINLPANDPIASEELTTEEWYRIIDEAADLGCLSITLTGGEPLLRPDFKDIYLHIRRTGILVELATNATLLTPELAELLANIPPRAPVQITLYGATASTYERITRLKGSYAAAVQGVRLLKTRSVPFILRGVLLADNLGEKDVFQRWAQELAGTSDYIDTTMMLDLRGRRDSLKKDRQISGLRLNPETATALKSENREFYFESMRRFVEQFMGPPGGKIFACGAGCSQGAVDAYGRCQPCLLLRHPQAVYNLRRGPLRDAFSDFFPRLRQTIGGEAYQRRCAGCFLKGLCEQCPAKSWSEHGDLDTPVEYYCQVAHRQAELLGLITAGEKAWEVRDFKQRMDRFIQNKEKTS